MEWFNSNNEHIVSNPNISINEVKERDFVWSQVTKATSSVPVTDVTDYQMRFSLMLGVNKICVQQSYRTGQLQLLFIGSTESSKSHVCAQFNNCKKKWQLTSGGNIAYLQLATKEGREYFLYIRDEKSQTLSRRFDLDTRIIYDDHDEYIKKATDIIDAIQTIWKTMYGMAYTNDDTDTNSDRESIDERSTISPLLPGNTKSNSEISSNELKKLKRSMSVPDAQKDTRQIDKSRRRKSIGGVGTVPPSPPTPSSDPSDLIDQTLPPYTPSSKLQSQQQRLLPSRPQSFSQPHALPFSGHSKTAAPVKQLTTSQASTPISDDQAKSIVDRADQGNETEVNYIKACLVLFNRGDFAPSLQVSKITQAEKKLAVQQYFHTPEVQIIRKVLQQALELVRDFIRPHRSMLVKNFDRARKKAEAISDIKSVIELHAFANAPARNIIKTTVIVLYIIASSNSERDACIKFLITLVSDTLDEKSSIQEAIQNIFECHRKNRGEGLLQDIKMAQKETTVAQVIKRAADGGG